MNKTKTGMAPFYSRFKDLASRETRCLSLRVPQNDLPPGEYSLIEFYCVDPECDCRRVIIHVLAMGQSNATLATINYGWESEKFYTQWLNGDAETAREMTVPTLDCMNPQSPHATTLLRLFQNVLSTDSTYIKLLEEHYNLFRDAIRKEQLPQLLKKERQNEFRTPKNRRERFDNIAALIQAFALEHLDDELTSFALELWARLCRRKAPDCMRGKPEVWAASVIHVIARMNFLFDKTQPIHLTPDTICNFFQANKTTIGSKASQIEKTLKLSPHCETGLCRRELVETFTQVRLSNGMIVPLKMAKELGLLPPDAMP